MWSGRILLWMTWLFAGLKLLHCRVGEVDRWLGSFMLLNRSAELYNFFIYSSQRQHTLHQATHYSSLNCYMSNRWKWVWRRLQEFNDDSSQICVHQSVMIDPNWWYLKSSCSIKRILSCTACNFIYLITCAVPNAFCYVCKWTRNCGNCLCTKVISHSPLFTCYRYETRISTFILQFLLR